jgi:preprotein translocase subunit SecE
VARNRKRAKERRARRPQPVVGRLEREEAEERQESIRHAAPDVEIAEAQMALGRPDLAAEAEGEPLSDAEEEGLAAEAELEEAEGEDLDEAEPGPSPETADDNELQYELESTPTRGGDGDGSARDGAEVAAAAETAPARRGGIFGRLIGFLRGSWAELQRVQWPDRRQVVQATGVVIGFVIVAGVFLGVADTLSQHVVSYILNGHW